MDCEQIKWEKEKKMACPEKGVGVGLTQNPRKRSVIGLCWHDTQIPKGMESFASIIVVKAEYHKYKMQAPALVSPNDKRAYFYWQWYNLKRKPTILRKISW